MADDISMRRKLAAIYAVARYRPMFTVGVVALSVVAAVLEGIGLSFILPIMEYARSNTTGDPSGLLQMFITAYDVFGVPFTLEYIVLGVGVVMVARYTASFVVAWLRATLRTDYVRFIRTRSFESVLFAAVSEVDQRGSDDILNTVITQSEYSSRVIRRLVELLEISLVTLVYLLIALYISPYLTLFAVLILGSSTYLLRATFESGYAIGDRVARANEAIQSTVQSGTQGLRDVKLFGMQHELLREFEGAMGEFVAATVEQRRNKAGINKFQRLISALSVFVLIYIGLEFASLTVGSLGVFLFAMFRLSPRVSTLNNLYYQTETEIPHLIRSREFIASMEAQSEATGDHAVPDEIQHVEFNDVTFAYDDSGPVLKDISFTAEAGEFIAFVGQSGAGKSTVVSLLTRLYEPDSGEVRTNSIPVSEFDLTGWRKQIAVVRQDPFVFNDTLRANLTIGNRDATSAEIQRVAEIASVDEFLGDLPNGYETIIGDDGVRLSGGQKQRVALARALLKDADVLILDEATSDLDTSIEAEVQSAIETMEREYITITVAHRLSTVKNADRIYTFEDGEITEVGSHEELLKSGGKYAEMHSK